nr:MAG TPA: hypothetical protein [Caudoviricetes sp.]
MCLFGVFHCLYHTRIACNCQGFLKILYALRANA